MQRCCPVVSSPSCPRVCTRSSQAATRDAAAVEDSSLARRRRRRGGLGPGRCCLAVETQSVRHRVGSVRLGTLSLTTPANWMRAATVVTILTVTVTVPVTAMPQASCQWCSMRHKVSNSPVGLQPKDSDAGTVLVRRRYVGVLGHRLVAPSFTLTVVVVVPARV